MLNGVVAAWVAGCGDEAGSCQSLLLVPCCSGDGAFCRLSQIFPGWLWQLGSSVNSGGLFQSQVVLVKRGLVSFYVLGMELRVSAC
jgi:hypothetical protein